MTAPNINTKPLILSSVFWSIFFIAQLLVSSLLAWEIGVQCNFGYSIGYKLLNIEQHIQTYAPQNKYKNDFVFTSENERLKLFEETVSSIQNQGAGLEQITYELPSRSQTNLYTPAEIVHLLDVSKLVSKFLLTGVLALFIWLIGLALIYRYRISFPSVRNILIGAIAFCALISIPLIWAGPTPVFYWLHTKIFPENHQWYFYYQESLMATFMKAPDLFGFIGAALAIGLIFLFLCASYLGKSISKR